MRLLEAVLAATLVLTLVVWVVPRLRSRHPRFGQLRHLTPILGVAALAQITLEGVRWQLYPAYLLAAVLLVLWLIGVLRGFGEGRRTRSERSAGFSASGGRGVPWVVRVLASGLGVFLLVIAVALPIALPVVRFDQPSGRYAVGSATYDWVDQTRPELFTSAADDRRELVARVWYPVDQADTDQRARSEPYLRAAEAVSEHLAAANRFPSFALDHFAQSGTNAIPNAPMSEAQQRFPVLLFLTGLNGFAESNTFQVQELVSQGFVVVALDQPGVTAATQLADGRVITGLPRDRIRNMIDQSLRPNRSIPSLHGTPLPEGIIGYFAEDVSFAIDRLTTLNEDDPDSLLTDRLDLDRLGTFGISLGGMNAAEACAEDDRLRSCLIMDVELTRNTREKGLTQPSMFITRDGDTMRMERRRTGGWPEDEIASTLGTMRSVFSDTPADSYFVSISGMFHLNFTDAASWSPLMSRLGLTGPIDGELGFEIVNRYSVEFFRHHLNGQPAPLLTRDRAPYPQVDFRRSVSE